jgi:hypothetical protein
MNKNEEAVKLLLEAQGFKVLRNGWPDFLCIRRGDEKCGLRLSRQAGIYRDLWSRGR